MNELDQAFWRLCDWLELNQNDLLKAVSAFSILAPAYYFVYYRTYLLPQFQLLFSYLLLTSFTELLGVATMHTKSGNMWMYNLYALAELGMFAAIYRRFCYVPLIRSFVKWSAIVCIALGFVSYVLNPLSYNAFIYTSTSVLITSYVILWCIETYITRKLGVNSLMLWFSVGAFIFYPTAQIAFTYGDVLARRPEGMEDLWNMILLLNISYHCFATGGILSLCPEE